jgi:hypothetical protein
MSNGQGFLLISKFVHLKFQKDQGDIIRVKISTKLLKFLQPVVKHNELSISEGKVKTFTHYHAFDQAFMLFQ